MFQLTRRGPQLTPRLTWGLNATVPGNLGVTEKLLQGLILTADQVELDKLDLDQVTPQFFHYVVQVTKSFTSVLYFCIFVALTSSIFVGGGDWILSGLPQ